MFCLTHTPLFLYLLVMWREKKEDRQEPLYTHPSWEWLEQNRGQLLWFDLNPTTEIEQGLNKGEELEIPTEEEFNFNFEVEAVECNIEGVEFDFSQFDNLGEELTGEQW